MLLFVACMRPGNPEATAPGWKAIFRHCICILAPSQNAEACQDIYGYMHSAVVGVQVERAKKCLDFASTCFIIHLGAVCWYSGFPASLEWCVQVRVGGSLRWQVHTSHGPMAGAEDRQWCCNVLFLVGVAWAKLKTAHSCVPLHCSPAWDGLLPDSLLHASMWDPCALVWCAALPCTACYHHVILCFCNHPPANKVVFDVRNRWATNTIGLLIMSLLGEWLCVRREMQDIPLSEWHAG